MRILREKCQICVYVLSLKLILVFKKLIFGFDSKFYFFWIILAEAFVLPELYVVLLCFVEESMKDTNSYV